MKSFILTTSIIFLVGCSQKSNQKNMEEIQKLTVENYVEAYNKFDIEGMIENLDSKVVFENVSGGNPDMKLEGIEAFRNQAEQATSYFKERKQTIKSWSFQEDTVIIQIDYRGILAIELPNGMKPGDTLELEGKSTFLFAGSKIAKIIDES